MRVVQYTQTATIRRRQFANRSTEVDSRLMRLVIPEPSLIRWKRIPEVNCHGLLKMLSNRLNSTRIERLVY